MSIRKKETLAAHVARVLEKEIFSGKYAPDFPLPSTRCLAARFGVSQRAVLWALDSLGKKDVLVRQERKGVFVKTRSVVEGAREILFFTYSEEPELHSIYRAVNELILHSGRKSKYDFFSRIVSSGNRLTRGRLERELGRLENLGFIDCAVFYSFFSEEQIRQCMELPYPVIFLGELPDSGLLPPGCRMISPDSKKMLLRVAEYAVKRQYRELVLFYREFSGNPRYASEAIQVMADYLKSYGMPYRMIPFPGQTMEEARNAFHKATPGIAAKLAPGTLIAVQSLHSDLFDDRLLLPREQYPGIDLLTVDFPRHPGKIKYLRRDYTGLQKKLMEFIESSGTPLDDAVRHEVVDYHHKVMEEIPTTNEVL